MTAKTSDKPFLTINGRDFQQLSGRLVYVWRRGNKYLYVGNTAKGLLRVMGHNVINRAEAVTEKDVIELYATSETDWWEGERLQNELCEAHLPKYSTPLMNKKCVELKCVVCNAKFMQARPWQRFCSKECRMGR